MMILALQMGGAGMGILIQFVLLIAIMYFLLIMPQRREQKRHREMLAALKRGDEVVERARVARLVNPPAAAK
jgi:preprotein translocase subunit YajC